ncbi:MAG: PIN domain-containing protein [Spirochaetaceae bacterium]|jgi:predicted nucleic acid-binding protein|nr:PIN domain-containing protein [Spirochaetaceae bacterium]
MTYVFDACALLALVNKEKGADVVQKLIYQAHMGTVSACINIVNFLEVFYKLIQQKGIIAADAFIKSILYASPIQIIDTISLALFCEAARFKTTYKLSLADSLALANASCTDGTLVTADHHELDAVDRTGTVHFLWIR